MTEPEASAPSVEGLEITGLLGRGATSRVYLGIQTRFDRPVAVKVLDLRGKGAPAADLVLNETRVLAMLSAHPNILTLYDAGVTEEGNPYLMTEYLPAGSFGPRLRRSGPLDPADVARIGVQLCGALGTAHLHDVVHGDVKPDNVLIGRIEQPLLGDFGVAAIRSHSEPSETKVLTPLHAAPELLDGGPTTVASDIYGLGSTLLALTTGFSPVGSAQERTDVILGRLHDGVRVERGRDGVPPLLLEALDRATARDPSERFGDVRELGEELQGFQRWLGQPTSDMHVMSDIPGPGNLPDLAALGAPDAELTVPPTHEPDKGPNRLLRVAVAAAVLVVLAGAAIALAVRDDGAEAASEPGVSVVDEPDTAPEEVTSTTADVPESNLAGIQPGISYNDPPTPDTSPELDALLAEEQVIFAQVPTPPVPRPYYGLVLNDLPATFHHQAYNSLEEEDRTACAGMMSRELVVTGLWERATEWADGALAVSVSRAADAEVAHELVTLLSIENGATSDQCWGIGYWNVVDYEDYGVDHRDIDGLLANGVAYNLWRQEDLAVGTKVWPQTTRLIMAVDEYVIDVSLATDVELDQSDEKVVATIARQIWARLGGA